MKVILLVDDKKLGKKNTIIDIADGYARNVLIPKKIVVEATAGNRNMMIGRIAKENYTHEQNKQEALKTKNNINALGDITFTLKCTPAGKIFGSITNKDIAYRLTELGIEVDKHNITLPKAIKDFGEYTVNIKLFEDINTVLVIKVIPVIPSE